MTAPKGEVRLADFPAVLMSIDEPWAEDTWQALDALWPAAHRVHGVRGLNACHQAAADVAGTEWFLTVDADTELLPAALDVTIPKAFLSPNFRLDWQSRNAVSGLISGNGSLKLWPRDLAMEMRSHEAAPEDVISLDADIGRIRPGKSRLTLMPGCVSVSDPARTPAHAFRAGFRETSFLTHLLTLYPGLGALPNVIGTWCSVGRHARHGPWVLYGARLGVWAVETWVDWDIRETYDYAWWSEFWNARILPRIGAGGGCCPWTGITWDADRLDEEIARLGLGLSERTDLPIADLDARESRLVAEAGLFPAERPQTIDALGRAFQKGQGVAEDLEVARELYEEAVLMGHPSAMNNLGRLHQLASNTDEAEIYFEAAMALGNPHAPYHLGQLLQGRAPEDRVAHLFDLAAERGFWPEDA